MAKRSKTQIEAMEDRAKKIGLPPSLYMVCTTEAQQDAMYTIMDEINLEYGLNYIVTVNQEASYGNIPDKDREDAIKALRKLKVYAKNYNAYTLEDKLSNITEDDIPLPPQRQKAELAKEVRKRIDELIAKNNLKNRPHGEALKSYFKNSSKL